MEVKDTVTEKQEIRELQELMPFTPSFCCKKCGEVLNKPVIRKFGYHIFGGGPMLSGEFSCPNSRWWNQGHTVLHLEYVGCNLDVFEGDKHFMHLWIHELDKAKKEAGKGGSFTHRQS